jgi:Rrf2 family protein
MLKITKKIEYALISLKFINDDKDGHELTTAREICSKFNMPFDTTSKVMQAMNNAGILKSEKGTKGGYALAKNLTDVSYMEIVQVVDQKSNDEEFCQSNKGLCDLYSSCNIVKPIDKLNATLNSYLKNLTINQLFNMAFDDQAPISNQGSTHV